MFLIPIFEAKKSKIKMNQAVSEPVKTSCARMQENKYNVAS